MSFFYFIAIACMLGSWVVQWMLKSRFQKYSQTAINSNMSGAEVAMQMLRDHNINDVQVFSVEGKLTDHYNPSDKTVNLSHDVYYGRNAAAVAVAAHEVGHAVQHATAYSMLQFRSLMVPALSAVNTFTPWLLLGGVLMLNTFPQLLFFGILALALSTVFSFITLPVEFDASRRALAWVKNRNIVTQSEYGMAKDALFWAATTYVVAALGSLAMLLHYISVFNSRRE